MKGFPERFEITVPREFFKYVSDHCKDQGDKKPITCTTGSPSLEIPEKARGKELIVEHVVITYGKRE